MFTPEQLSSFSDLEYMIYNYVTTHADKVVLMRIRELAEATHVSPTTILRFCRKLGCDGFSEFKTKLKLYLQETNHPFITSAQDSLFEFFERTLKTDYEQTIQTVAKVIAEAEHVIFVGAGSSGILAEYGSRYFSAFKKFSLHIKDPFFPIYGHYLRKSVSIVLSVSGETPHTLSQAHRLKEEGSIIISITNRKHCSLAQMSDYNIAYYVNMEFVEQANITTQIPVVYLLESLAKETYRIVNQK
ncbi:MurR/RpiR family transcriptional regulator [Thermaerobacillus caldiproteolyticus]|uniref:DNA-binding MurR/RpiR family transcriptional regulator n=1 Tax=Thermaerobacillus caldiproteolyticus TaxID=247480 RepID=A0A7W0BZJ8_9BACL|nr:MurR/RpiR family transcriptional regulator [Anoxybacillus caldiproteolyticus]MBA2874526.1 DNA-binding MurR/RpiR family transcriptional regulator [Anoxybacillus caldiproteolyticus]